MLLLAGTAGTKKSEYLEIPYPETLSSCKCYNTLTFTLPDGYRILHGYEDNYRDYLNTL